MKINASNPEHRALIERFLVEQPTHRPFLDPQRQTLLLVSPDTYAPIEDVLDEIQIVAMDTKSAEAAYAVAVKAHEADALGVSERMSLERDIRSLNEGKTRNDERYPFSDADTEKLAAMEAKLRAANKRGPKSPELQCTAEVAKYVYLAMRVSGTDELVAALIKKHGVDACMAENCDDPVMQTRNGTPRFGTRHWDSITPWSGCGFCDAHHADEFSDGRTTAFRAFAVWQMPAMVQMANELAGSAVANKQLVDAVDRMTAQFKTPTCELKDVFT